ncbi:MAG: tyrosine-protein phosphatase [Gammaproteobacteria bacterium]|nr:tyrosine-protein phosphatase [Gammaproteobacteria bacterium]
MLIPDAVHVWQEADGQYHVEWRTTEPDVEVRVEHAHGETFSANYLPHLGAAKLSGLPGHRRHAFVVRDQYGTQVLAQERRLPLQGTPNFRDFGGYRTVDGKTVQWGYLYRSGQLASLSEQDVALVASLGLDIICDFRREEEQQTEPSLLPAEKPPRIVSLPIIPGSNSRFFEEAEGMVGDRQAMFDFMLEINRDFAQAQAPTYARMFKEILEQSDARFLVHCAAGKDRTGFAVALVLLALGVPREVVMSDYMLTSRFFDPQEQIDRLKAKYQMEHMAAEAVLPMLEVHEDYLARAFMAIDEQYASIDVYLAEALGVGAPEVAELRGRYLRQAQA